MIIINTIALLGNPNVGKSTIFNNLTGLNQHTGNWTGKTVETAKGTYLYRGEKFEIVDLPGTYSLIASSKDEVTARDYIIYSKPDLTLIIVDATCLERNLNLVFQTLEFTDNVIVCVNLIDEAKRKGIAINTAILSDILGIPVLSACGRKKKNLEALKEEIYRFLKFGNEELTFNTVYDEITETGILPLRSFLKKYIKDKKTAKYLSLNMNIDEINSLCPGIPQEELINIIKKTQEYFISHDIAEICDLKAQKIYENSELLFKRAVTITNRNFNERDRKIDRILTSKIWGFPIMLALLGIIFLITIKGANYPSALLSAMFGKLEILLKDVFSFFNAGPVITSLLIDGVYKTLSWVVAVMLPPMAIFFPLFTLLEDLGYLPRIAFNLDNYFKRCSACGKQALTMCMGLGCNAVGVTGTRIIDSKRERLIAILTNNFMPCNGRFPTLIAIITMFFAGVQPYSGTISAIILLALIIFGIFMTFGVSKLLSGTLLKGAPSSFILELPPYRRPQIGKIIVRSIFDRTLFVLARAVSIAAPAGLIIWIMSNVSAGGATLLEITAGFLDPFAALIGLDGVILIAFILGFPANEIVVPIIIMAYMSAGQLTDYSSLAGLKNLLDANGWTALTAVNTMLFSLIHFPCSTTLLTIKKETGSLFWTAMAFVIPTLCGIIICFAVTQLYNLAVFLM